MQHGVKRLKTEKEGWTSRVIKNIKRHKLITTIVITFFVFAAVNIFMIENFMRILQSV